jgi:hypothetical protein
VVDNMILTVAAKQQQTKPGGMKGRHLSKCWEAGQEPPSTPDPTDRCSGENLANLTGVPRPSSSGGHSDKNNTSHPVVGDYLTELFLCCPRFIGNIGKRTTNKSWQE